MKTKTTIILLIAAALLCIYVCIFELGLFSIFTKFKLPTTDELEQAKSKIFALKSKDITRIELTTPNASQLTVGNSVTPTKVTIVCAKDADDKWSMLQPVETKADQSFLESVANQIAELTKSATIPEKDVKDLANYGLKEPNFVVTFLAKDKANTVKIGKEAPMEQGVYLSVEGQKNIYITPKYFGDLINKPVFDFRNKKILEINPYDAGNIKFVHTGQTIELKKNFDEWHLAQPISEKADQNKVRDLLSALSTLSANSFVADKEIFLQKYGLDKPEIKLIMMDSKNPPVTETVVVGAEWEKDKYIAFKEGGTAIFTINKGAFDQLNIALELLRNKKLFDLEMGRLNSVQIKFNQKQVVQIDKDAAKKWQFTYPPISNTEAVPYDVDSFIDKLNNMLVEQFISDTPTDLAPYGLGEPFSGIELSYSVGSPAMTSNVLFGLGRLENKSPYTYIKEPNRIRLVAVSASVYEYLRQGSTLFRKKSLIDITFDRIKKLTLTAENRDVTPTGFASLAYEQDKPQEWKMLSPNAEALGKSENLNNLAVELSHLTVSEFVVDTNCLDTPDLSNFGLDKAPIIITMDIESKDKKTSVTRTLYIGKKSNDNYYYAQLSDDFIVFKIPLSIVEPVNKLFEAPNKK